MSNAVLVQSVNNSTAISESQRSASILIEALNHNPCSLLLVVVAYIFLCATSGYVVKCVFEYAGIDNSGNKKDTGTAIGKVENILVLTLMLLEAYTALGVIFAAKSIVRKDDIDTGDTTYYLTGSISNFTYSIIIGIVLHMAVIYIIL